MAKNELDLQMEDYQYLPLRDVVFRTLRQAILRGELKPGERLMEIRLANQLGVSRTPIREAIRMLELDGLVIMVPRKGAQVAQITEKDLNDVLYGLRAFQLYSLVHTWSLLPCLPILLLPRHFLSRIYLLVVLRLQHPLSLLLSYTILLLLPCS